MSDTSVIIRSARRPVLVARHREVILELDGALGEAFIVGVPGNRRLEEMHQRLDQPEQAEAVRNFLDALCEEPATARLDLRTALIEQLCLMREDGLTEGARLQEMAIGAYRQLRMDIARHQGGILLDLAALRALPVPTVAAFRVPRAFGDPAFPRTSLPGFQQQFLGAINALLHPQKADSNWHDEDGGLRITLTDAATADPEAAARDRIRSSFYRGVFMDWMSPDSLEPKEVDSHAHVLAWLQDLNATPHLYPFLQGQTPGQKAFRIAQLTGKLIRLYELYARVAQASASPLHQAELSPLDTRGRLTVLARLRYPPIRATAELTLATAACPFPVLVAFIQDRLRRGDLVLPPEPRR